MDQDVKKKLKGLDGTAVPVGYDSLKDTGHSVLEASKSLEQNIDGLTDGSDGNTKDERQVKREKRKQANRESARRSRLRKQAEYEELVRTFESLNTEKMALKSKLEELKGDSEKLRLENATLMEKLKHAQIVPQGGIASIKIEVNLDLPTGTENILSNLGSVSRNAQLDCEAHESSMSETKLHAVAAR